MGLFVVLELIKGDKTGIFPRIAAILTKPKARLREETAFGVPYGVVTAPLTKQGDPPWDEIGALAGRFAGRMLLPDGLLPEESAGISEIGEISCPQYERRVLAETAAAIIRQTRMPLYRRVLGFIDRDGECSDLLPGLLRHFTSVKVVTQREALYETVREQMMEELGAPVLAGSSLSLLSGCALTLATGPAMGEEAGSYPSPVLGAAAFVPRIPCELIRDPEPAASEELRRCCPPGIAAHRFAAALYEDAGVETGGFVAAKLRYNQRQTELQTIVSYVTERVKLLSLY